MYNCIEFKDGKCLAHNYDTPTSVLEIPHSYSDFRGTFKRRKYHDCYMTDIHRIDVYYNNDGTLKIALIYYIFGQTTPLQKNIYRNGKIKKIIVFGVAGCKDEYIFKDDRVIYKFMYIDDWRHTIISIDYINMIKYTHSYNKFSKRILEFDRKDVYVLGESI